MGEMKLFENTEVRRHWDAELEQWYFSVVDVIGILSDSVNPTDYLKKLRKRDNELAAYLGTNCPQVAMLSNGKRRKILAADYWRDAGVTRADEFALLTNIIHQEWSGLQVKEHKNLKGLQTHNLRDHMSEAELIFTALAELSTRQIADSEQAIGVDENAKVSKRGGTVAKNARLELEAQTGKSVVTGENFLPPMKATARIKP